MGDGVWNAVVPGVLFGGMALAWLIICVRWALRVRTTPDRTPEAFLAHYRAVGSTVIFVCVVLAFASVLLGGQQEAALWIPPTLAIGVVVLGERHWPRPEGAIRTAVIGPPRSWASLLPRFSSAVAVFSVLAAGVSLWPWSGVGLVAVLGLAVLWVVAGIAVRDVHRRPSLPGIPPVGDTTLRQVAVGRIVRLVALGGLLTVAAALSRSDALPGWSGYVCLGLIAAMIIGWRRPRRQDLAVVAPSSETVSQP